MAEDQSSKLIEKVNQNLNLQKILGFSDQKIGEKALKSIDFGLKSDEYLMTIHLKNCYLETEDCEKVGNLLKNSSKISKIILQKNRNMGNGLQILFEGLTQSLNILVSIQIIHCNLNAEQCEHIGNLLKSCSKLETVALEGTLYFEKTFSKLLPSSNTLKEIHFINCNLCPEHCLEMEKLLICCSKIEIINLRGNTKLGRGLINICQGLRHSSSSLREICFQSCHLKRELCSEIANLLKSSSQIELINLEDNFYMGCRLVDICQGLLNSSNTLKKIYLGNCNLGENICSKIGDLLKSCSQIQVIYLYGNMNMGSGLSDLCQGLLNSSNSLKKISFSECRLNMNQSQYVANLIENCCRIEEIYMGYNIWMREGLADICHALLNSSNTLKHIHFPECDFCPKSVTNIKILMERCSRLETIIPASLRLETVSLN